VQVAVLSPASSGGNEASSSTASTTVAEVTCIVCAPSAASTQIAVGYSDGMVGAAQSSGMTIKWWHQPVQHKAYEGSPVLGDAACTAPFLAVVNGSLPSSAYDWAYWAVCFQTEPCARLHALHAPQVRIWDFAARECLVTLKGHKVCHQQG
jgi:hypothetical protein